jgi:hypothetical protein
MSANSHKRTLQAVTQPDFPERAWPGSPWRAPSVGDSIVKISPRGLASLKLLKQCACHSVATPVNWQPGDDVIIVPSVSDEEARKKFPAGWKAPKPYLRIVPQPAG